MSRNLGLGLVMIAIGAILAFAVTASVGFVNLRAVGYILIVVGIVGVLVDLFLFAPRRRDDYDTRDRYRY